ncbi:MAG: S9 family peptidase [Lachnospiraceae bacterium]|nr:S9 family peptidase [Lachnospiraceae bacterium]
MEKIQINDILGYSFVSDARFSPDGRKIAFLVKNSAADQMSYDSALWILEDGKEKKVSGDYPVGEYFWRDSQTIWFTSVYDAEDKEKKEAGITFTSIYRLHTATEKVEKVYMLPVKATSFERYDESHIVIHAMIDALHPDYHQMSEEERAQIGKEKKAEEDYLVVDETPFYYNATGYTNKLRRGLFFWDLETGELDRITPPLMDTYQTAIHQGKVAYIGFNFTHKWESWHDVFLYDPLTGETVCVYDRKDHRFWAMFSLGGKLYVRAAIMGHPESYSCPGEVYELDVEHQELKLFSNVESSMANMVTSDARLGGGKTHKNYNGLYYYLETAIDDSVISAYAPDGSYRTVFSKTGTVDCFDIDENTGRMIGVCMFDNKLAEVYELNPADGTCTQLSHITEKALSGKYVADYHPVTAISGGDEVYGYVLLPENFDPEKTYPAILEIHGGPKGAYGQIFHHEMQMYAGAGYIVFFCNPTGSDGRGHHYAQIFHRLGEKDYQDIMAFTDEVLRRYPQIDPARVGVSGGSYGGFMTNWIIGHTDRFACAVSQRSISNWISFAGTSDIGYSAKYQTGARGASFYDEPERYWSRSPIAYACHVVTPTLFIHSDEDYRCPLEQGMQMFTALADKGVETRMCIFKGENHELSRAGKPKHRIRRLTEMKNWMDSHLMK